MLPYALPLSVAHRITSKASAGVRSVFLSGPACLNPWPGSRAIWTRVVAQLAVRAWLPFAHTLTVDRERLRPTERKLPSAEIACKSRQRATSQRAEITPRWSEGSRNGGRSQWTRRRISVQAVLLVRTGTPAARCGYTRPRIRRSTSTMSAAAARRMPTVRAGAEKTRSITTPARTTMSATTNPRRSLRLSTWPSMS